MKETPYLLVGGMELLMVCLTVVKMAELLELELAAWTAVTTAAWMVAMRVAMTAVGMAVQWAAWKVLLRARMLVLILKWRRS